MKNVFKCLILLLISFVSVAGPMMVSHKGIWKDFVYPQNTLASLRKALDNGFKGVEFDLHVTKDKKLILAHDDKIKTVSDCRGAISKMLLSELKKCKIDKNTLLPIGLIPVHRVKRPQFFTSFKEVLEIILVDPRLKLAHVDIKQQDLEIADIIVKELRELSDQTVLEKITLNSSSRRLLGLIKEQMPELRLSIEGKYGSEPLTQMEKYFDGIGIDYDMISLNIGLYLGHEPIYKICHKRKRFRRYYQRYLNEAKARGIETIGWTVNNKRKLKYYKQSTIEYLITDRLIP